MIKYRDFLEQTQQVNEIMAIDNNKENATLAKKNSKSLTEQQVIELLKSPKYSQAVENFSKSIAIFRGVLTDEKYFTINPKSFIRKSANTYNYATLFVDNNSMWKPFPKRSQSLICTQNISQADDYGLSFVVFPENNSNIGICPPEAEDFWFSFKHTMSIDLDHFNIKIHKIAKTLDIYDTTSYAELIQLCSEIDKNQNTIQIKVMLEDLQENTKPKYKGDFLKYISEILTPTTFKHTKINSLTRGLDEVWTDGECILVEHKQVANIMKQILGDKF
jgi:hypothetical protein